MFPRVEQKPTASTVVTSLPHPTPAPDISQERAMREQLEPKVRAGMGSLDNLRMLKGICAHMGDHACRDHASELLKKKLAESP